MQEFERRAIWHPGQGLRRTGSAKYVPGLGLLPKRRNGRASPLAVVEKTVRSRSKRLPPHPPR